MKHKKILFILLVIVVIFLIYKNFNNNKINYLPLGDSIAAGENSYGELGYGYVDYIRDYLKEHNKLNLYTKDYTKSGYKIDDILDDIENNKKVKISKKTYNIKELLRESDIVTISIGANDFLEAVDANVTKLDQYKLILDNIFLKMDNLIKEIRKYAKKDIYLVGYYNPQPVMLNSYQKEIEEMLNYAKNKFKNICKTNNLIYIDIQDDFKNNPSYLPNPFNIHPNIKGYEKISSKIIGKIKKNLEN